MRIQAGNQLGTIGGKSLLRGPIFLTMSNAFFQGGGEHFFTGAWACAYCKLKNVARVTVEKWVNQTASCHSCDAIFLTRLRFTLCSVLILSYLSFVTRKLSWRSSVCLYAFTLHNLSSHECYLCNRLHH